MPLSVHSHSGQFCRHAVGSLADMVGRAVECGFVSYGLSEHMPRTRLEDLYPEEADMSVADLETVFGAYVKEARRLQAALADQIELLVGMETEVCHSGSHDDIERVRKAHSVDYLVGSVHHVQGTPIDFDLEKLELAEADVGGTEALFLTYFGHVREMIRSCRPEVVGHIDLVRLFRPEFELTPAVWEALDAAIQAGIACNALFEINSAGLRKQLGSPYPHSEVLQRILQLGGKVTISDDAHRVEHVGTHYKELREFLLANDVQVLHCLRRRADGLPGVEVAEFPSWRDAPFWTKSLLFGAQ